MPPSEGLEPHEDVNRPSQIQRGRNWLCRLIFGQVAPLISKGGRIVPQDCASHARLDSRSLVETFNRAWADELTKPTPKLRRVLLRGHKWVFLITAVLYVVSTASAFAGPLLLNRIVAGLACRNLLASLPPDLPVLPQCTSKDTLYLYACLLMVAPLIASFASTHSNLHLAYVGAQLRNQLMAVIFRKCIRLDNDGLQSESIGKIVTLISSDTARFQAAINIVHDIWGTPLVAVAVMVLLYNQVAWSSFVGLGTSLLLIPIATLLAARLAMFRRSMMLWTDRRVAVVAELLAGIRFIKLASWEALFARRIYSLRRHEARLLRWMAVVGSLLSSVMFMGPVLMTVAAFGSYTAAGNVLTIARAYTALLLFLMIRTPLTLIPMLVTVTVEANVALQRISGFLQRDDAGSTVSKADHSGAVGQVSIKGGEFRWAAAQPQPTLANIDFRPVPGGLTLLVGPIGGGKSSLIAALIGYIRRSAGAVTVNGRQAYVAQTAWILNETVQSNIVLGGDFDPERYRRACESAQLGQDLAILVNGDQTEIGEQGVTLSGGQKQRVSLARAIYADADVVLLDDPLSALDAHVGRAVFEDCVQRELAGKTRIMATNQMHLLPYADHVVWLENGEIKHQGTPAELEAAGVHLDADVLRAQNGQHNPIAHDVQGLYPTMMGPGGPGPHPHPLTTGPGGPQPVAGLVSITAVPPAPLEHPPGPRTPRSRTDSALSGAPHSSSSPSMLSPRDALGACSAIINPLAEGGLQGGQPLLDDQRLPPTTTRPAPAKGGDAAPVGVSTKLQSNLGGLTGVEKRAEGTISRSVLALYYSAMGGVFVVLVLLLLFVVEQGIKVFSDRWVGMWTGDRFGKSNGFYVRIYVLIAVVYSALVFVRSLCFTIQGVRASVRLHENLLAKVLRLPVFFFDSNPSGRVMSRFSRDTEIIDAALPTSTMQVVGLVTALFAVVAVVSWSTPYFLVGLFPIMVVYVLVQRWYLPAGRELKRCEAITRSPIFSGVAEALEGLVTIRAYGKQEMFSRLNDDRVEINGRVVMAQSLVAAWLSLRLDLIGVVIVALAGTLAVHGRAGAALAGLALVYALEVSRMLKQTTAQIAGLETQMNSVERVQEYLGMPDEGEGKLERGPDPPPEWPSHGAVSIKGLQMSYRPDSPIVLDRISLEVKPGTHVGVCGRTGSGKSSLFLTLLRMVEPRGGSMHIDGVDLRTVQLSRLRSAICMVPQDPFMFSGTVRDNADPSGQWGDAAVRAAVKAVGLGPCLEQLPQGLASPVMGGGRNFSQGQRQLFCLARAMLQKSRVILMDEATASVDQVTDELLQRATQSAFKHCTLITIAHRLKTIVDYEEVVVMQGGRIAEHSSPHKLLADPASLFSSLVDDSGVAHALTLRRSALAAANARATAVRPDPSGDADGPHARLPVWVSALEMNSGDLEPPPRGVRPLQGPLRQEAAKPSSFLHRPAESETSMESITTLGSGLADGDSDEDEGWPAADAPDSPRTARTGRTGRTWMTALSHGATETMRGMQDALTWGVVAPPTLALCTTHQNALWTGAADQGADLRGEVGSPP